MPTIRTIGPFRLDPQAELLFRGAEPVALGRRAVALLCALTERPGAVVSKDALIEAAWSDVAIEESNLTVQIAALRRLLGEEPEGESWIETLPRRGYRFVGPVVATEEEVEAARPQAAAAAALPGRPSVAVLPFANMSGDPEQEHVADGITEEIITALSKLGWLPVVARNSSFVYKGRSVPITQVGSELGVRYVLEGSVRKSGNRLRITGQLVEAEKGEHLWAERYDRDDGHLFAVQDEVTQLMVKAIAPAVRELERRRTGRDPGEEADEPRAGRWLETAAERRQLTVMSCELVAPGGRLGGSELEELRSVIGIYHGIVADIAGRFEGFAGKHVGNTVLVYFGYPAAHEDDAEQAVRAGLELCSAMRAVKLRADVPLQCRIGIATGLVIVGDVVGVANERGITGDPPNLAIRLQALSKPSTVTIDQTTLRLVGNLFDCQALDAIEAAGAAGAGAAEPVPAWRVVGARPLQSRFEALRSADMTPLVGRSEELETLARRWRQAARGEGRLVLITGEPGIGKSRLTAALQQRVREEAHTHVRYFCSQHHQDSALYPVIRQLARSAGFERDHMAGDKLHKLAALLAAADPAEGDISLIAELMSLPGGEAYPPLDLGPQRKREQTLAALLRQFEGMARRQPLLVTFEDLHWIDPTSREMLDLLAERIDRLPVLLVATCRPELQPPWIELPATTLVALNRLGRTDAAALVRQVAGNAESLSPELVDEIVERTNGVPLFVEELTKAVLENGTERNPRTIAAAPPLSPEIPATLHASLMARLDRLGPVAKQVAQIGATVGKEFSYELLTAASPLPEPLVQGELGRLVAAGLVFQRGPVGGASYRFKHALVQDMAYATLLKPAREELHAKIAAALEQRFPEQAGTQPELLAHHFAKAGMPDKAADYFLRAGQLAIQRSALVEAVHHLERGLQVLDEALAARPPESRALTERAIDLRLTLQGALYPQGEIERALDHLGAAESSADSLLDQQRLGRVLAHMTFCFFWMGDRDRAIESGERALAVAAGLEDFPLRVLTNHRLGQAYFHTGEFRRAAEVLRWNVEKLEGKLAYERLGLPVLPSIGSRAYLGWSLATLGDFASASAIVAEGVRIAEAAQHAYSTVGMYWCAAMPAFLQGKLEEAVTWLERAQDLHRREYIALLFPLINGVLGEAYARRGRLAEGVALVEQAAEQLRSMRMMGVYSATLVSLSTVYGLAARPADALQSAEQALQLSRAHRQRGIEADALRLLGDLHANHAPANVEAADRSYRDATALASALGMRPLVAHCELGLGKLRGRAGARAAARHHLVTAATMFREMDMQLCRQEAETELQRPG